MVFRHGKIISRLSTDCNVSHYGNVLNRNSQIVYEGFVNFVVRQRFFLPVAD
jgi:hypothetical protein